MEQARVVVRRQRREVRLREPFATCDEKHRPLAATGYFRLGTTAPMPTYQADASGKLPSVLLPLLPLLALTIGWVLLWLEFFSWD